MRLSCFVQSPMFMGQSPMHQCQSPMFSATDQAARTIGLPEISDVTTRWAYVEMSPHDDSGRLSEAQLNPAPGIAGSVRVGGCVRRWVGPDGWDVERAAREPDAEPTPLHRAAPTSRCLQIVWHHLYRDGPITARVNKVRPPTTDYMTQQRAENDEKVQQINAHIQSSWKGSCSNGIGMSTSLSASLQDPYSDQRTPLPLRYVSLLTFARTGGLVYPPPRGFFAVGAKRHSFPHSLAVGGNCPLSPPPPSVAPPLAGLSAAGRPYGAVTAAGAGRR